MFDGDEPSAGVQVPTHLPGQPGPGHLVWPRLRSPEPQEDKTMNILTRLKIDNLLMF